MMYGSPASSAAPQPSPTDGNKNLWVPPYPALFFDHQRLFHKYYDVWATELMKRRTQYGQNLRKTVGSTRVQDHQEGPSILPCQPEPCLLLLVMIFFKSGIPPPQLTVVTRRPWLPWNDHGWKHLRDSRGCPSCQSEAFPETNGDIQKRSSRFRSQTCNQVSVLCL